MRHTPEISPRTAGKLRFDSRGLGQDGRAPAATGERWRLFASSAARGGAANSAERADLYITLLRARRAFSIMDGPTRF